MPPYKLWQTQTLSRPWLMLSLPLGRLRKCQSLLQSSQKVLNYAQCQVCIFERMFVQLCSEESFRESREESLEDWIIRQQKRRTTQTPTNNNQRVWKLLQGDKELKMSSRLLLGRTRGLREGKARPQQAPAAGWECLQETSNRIRAGDSSGPANGPAEYQQACKILGSNTAGESPAKH